MSTNLSNAYERTQFIVRHASLKDLNRSFVTVSKNKKMLKQLSILIINRLRSFVNDDMRRMKVIVEVDRTPCSGTSADLFGDV
mgnify:CR=1 FL=1